MYSDNIFFKHALEYSAITFTIAALAANFLFYNFSSRAFDKKPIIDYLLSSHTEF